MDNFHSMSSKYIIYYKLLGFTIRINCKLDYKFDSSLNVSQQTPKNSKFANTQQIPNNKIQYFEKNKKIHQTSLWQSKIENFAARNDSATIERRREGPSYCHEGHCKRCWCFIVRERERERLYTLLMFYWAHAWD